MSMIIKDKDGNWRVMPEGPPEIIVGNRRESFDFKVDTEQFLKVDIKFSIGEKLWDIEDLMKENEG